MSTRAPITFEIVGAERSIIAFQQAGEATITRVRQEVRRLGYELERSVKTDWLNGGALNRRTGRLARSINMRFESTKTSETASVGTNVFYGRIWELTGTRAFTMVPRNKKALFWPGAAHPVRSVNRPAMAPRPFLRPALDAMRTVIRERLLLATFSGGSSPSRAA